MERPKSKSLTLKLNTEELNMSLDLSFNEREPKDERVNRIVKIMEEFPKLSPELQEAVIKFAEALIKEKKSDGQSPPT